MPPARQEKCRRGLHDLTDPANVRERRNGQGGAYRVCKPCRTAWRREYAAARRRMIGMRKRDWEQPFRPCAAGLAVLQLMADGLTRQEAAEAAGISEDAVRQRLARAQRCYGVGSTAAAVYAALLRRQITAVPRNRHPMPPASDAVRGHACSVAALVRGERKPCRNPQKGPQQRMLDDLYAFTEAHAVSVLWAARMITRDGDPHWKQPETTMTRADHATAA